VSAATGMPRTTVVECLGRARAAGVTWPLPDGLDDRALEGLLYRRAEVPPASRRPTPVWADVHRELRRRASPSQFVHHYRQWAVRLDVVLRQEHRAGEKMFLDFAGQTLPITDPMTGVVTPAQLFVAVLGGEQLHLRRGVALTGAAAVDLGQRPRAGVLWRCFGDLRPRLCSALHNRGCVPGPVMWLRRRRPP
jgi:hypothetical protein